MELIDQYADKIIFPSEYVLRKITENIPLKHDKVLIKPQGLFSPITKRLSDIEIKKIKKLLDIPIHSKIVLSIGYGDKRKGIDIFLKVSEMVIKQCVDVHFIWIGHYDQAFVDHSYKSINKALIEKNVHLLGLIPIEEIDQYFLIADIFYLPSREDPFPSVVLQAMDAGLPVIGFSDAGGFEDIVTNNTGILVPYLDFDKNRDCIIYLLNNETERKKLGANARELIQNHYSFKDYVFYLLNYLFIDIKKVSVIIPNYNYAHYLEERFRSILNQDYPIYEIIILDDNSKDESLKMIDEFKRKHPLVVSTYYSKENSGSVYKQWFKGISLSHGDYIWIAEADDLADNSFLSNLMKGFHDEKVVLSFSNSRQIDSNGVMISPDYSEYLNEIEIGHWSKEFQKSGKNEIANYFSIKNPIPNVSAVVFKKQNNISDIINQVCEYSIAGDWFFYIWLLEKGDVYYSNLVLNSHRRHLNSICAMNKNKKHYEEIVRVQNYVKDKYQLKPEIIEKIKKYRIKVKKFLEIDENCEINNA